MKIVKNPQGEFGGFDLVPDEGMEIYRTFIDYESGLLIAKEIEIMDHSFWLARGYKASSRPNVIIDTKTQRVVNKDDLATIFDYSVKEIEHPEHQLKSIVRRVHDDEMNSDSYDNILISTETGKVIMRFRRDAFSKDPVTYTIFDCYISQLKEKEEEAAIKYGEYPEELYAQDQEQLKDGSIFQYQRKRGEELFELIRENGRYLLYRHKSYSNREFHNDFLYEKFDSPKHFWYWFTGLPDWFLEFEPRHIDRVFNRDIIYFFNDLKKKWEFDYEQHKCIHKWESKVSKFSNIDIFTVFLQYCARCGQRVLYYPRYPKHICRDCCSLLTDENGDTIDWIKLELAFINSKEHKAPCYIDGAVYWAEEARFGGMAVQKGFRRYKY